LGLSRQWLPVTSAEKDDMKSELRSDSLEWDYPIPRAELVLWPLRDYCRRINGAITLRLLVDMQTHQAGSPG